ncbi:MAG: hypothetical protein LCH39_01755 [Proteobacteria bacterium]|nr:hypothetical protein [Pseudomonadota bacterium]
MKQFIIKQAGWMEDGFGVSAWREAGNPIELLPEQETYLLLSEAIEAPPAALPPAVQETPAALMPVEVSKPAKGDSKNVRD